MTTAAEERFIQATLAWRETGRLVEDGDPECDCDTCAPQTEVNQSAQALLAERAAS